MSRMAQSERGERSCRFLGAGWSGREQNGDISFRWALGPESVVIAPLKSPDLLLPGEPQQQPGYLLRFRAQPYHEGEQTIEFWVNGELVGHQPLAPQTAEYEITIPSWACQGPNKGTGERDLNGTSAEEGWRRGSSRKSGTSSAYFARREIEHARETLKRRMALWSSPGSDQDGDQKRQETKEAPA